MLLCHIISSKKLFSNEKVKEKSENILSSCLNFCWMSNILCVIFRTVALVFIVVIWNNISATVSSGLPQVSLDYLDIEMIQPGKLFLKLDCFQVESFLWPDKQWTPEKDRRIQWPKRRTSTNNNKDEDNSLKKHTHKNSLCFIIVRRVLFQNVGEVISAYIYFRYLFISVFLFFIKKKWTHLM